MQPKEKAVIIALGLFILGIATFLALLGLFGIVDFSNGLGFIANQAALISLIFLCFVSGYVLMRSRHQEPLPAPAQEVEPDETVWPPPPTKEPGSEKLRA